MRIKGDKYTVQYKAESGIIVCSGVLDLRGKESYEEIASLFDHVINDDARPPETVTLDITRCAKCVGVSV